MDTNKATVLHTWKKWMMVKNFFPRTIQERLYRITKLFSFLDQSGISVTEITYPVAMQFFEWVGTEIKSDGNSYAKASIDGWLRSATSFGDFLVDAKILTTNCFRGLDSIHLDKSLPRTLLKENDMKTLLDYLRDTICEAKNLVELRRRYKVHVITEVLYATGLRVNELSHIKETDIDISRKVIKVEHGKGGYKREAFLNEYASCVLAQYISLYKSYMHTSLNSEYLFGTGSRNIMQALKTELDRACKALELGKIRSHDFRHCFAYHLLRSGCDIRRIQTLLGHRSIQSTEIYTRVEKEDLRNIIDQFHPRTIKEGGNAQ